MNIEDSTRSPHYYASLVRCSKCKEEVSADEVQLLDVGGGLVEYWCQYCVDDRIAIDDAATISKTKFTRLAYERGDQRAHERLERAEDNLREAVRRYLKNCPSSEMVRKIVASELDE